MKSITKDQALTIAQAQDLQHNRGFRERLDGSRSIYQLTLEDADQLFETIWHYRPESKVLTPGTWYGGKLYTVGDVADYMIQQGWTFDDLVNGTLKGTYSPPWFESCQKLVNTFTYDKFGTLFVQPSHHHERRDCPHSLFKILDGTHRALVLSYLVKTNAIEFAPIDCICLVPHKW